MTGRTLQLEPHQVKELLTYSNGEPRRPERRPDNLLRRGMLTAVGEHGETAYVITQFGRDALHAQGYATARPHSDGDEKIELHAIYRKRGAIEIRDQHGREIDGVPESLASAMEAAQRVIVSLQLEAPRWPEDKPHVEIRLRVPLEVEERLPAWMRDFFGDRVG